MTTFIEECTEMPEGLESRLPGSKVISIRVPQARMLDEIAFSKVTQEAYDHIHAYAMRIGYPHIIRMWNFIPGIHDLMETGHDRYMAFNAGRFRAMCEWFGGADHLRQSAPAATGVGWSGDDLHIHALTSHSPGTMFQNPAQIPSVSYSSRYGQMPPSFARATKIDNILFISGTASISGEDTQHVGEIESQWSLSIEHIARLIKSCWHKDETHPLKMVDSVRIYIPEPSNKVIIESFADKLFKHAKVVELVRADLCRRELLVEIECTVTEL